MTAPTTGLCGDCGGTFAADGYCTRCGAKAPNPRDHLAAAPAPWVAGVCDRGVLHPRNEDAMALAADPEPGGFACLVVCDGVSTAPRSDEASLAAADAALAVLVGAGATPDWAALLQLAAVAGDDAVAAVAGPDAGHDCPSCTFVAAVLDGNTLVATSVGDSRAYWLPDAGPSVALTTDDSWAQDMIALGMPRAQAEQAPNAHAITRWLGPDSPPVTTHATTRVLDAPGWLLVCSDGLWNYCSEAADLARLVAGTAAVHPQPADCASALVDWANAQGGHDNVTVTLARVAGPADGTPATPSTGTSTGTAGAQAPAPA